MEYIVLATETLERAEKELREIVAKAAASGDYACVVQIASWAKILRDQLEPKLPRHEAAPPSSDRNGSVAPAKNGVGQRKTKRAADDYPRFFRRGDELIRIAWSRRARSEYQHKTTDAVLKTVAETLSRLGRKGRIFSTDEVLPLRDPQGAEVPAYQAYVCIALLKLTGLIEQRGRQGYSIASPDDLTSAVDAIWRKLPLAK